MKKKGICLSLLIIVLGCALMATSVNRVTAQQVAQAQLDRINSAQDRIIDSSLLLQQDNTLLGYVFLLKPVGYIVISDDDNLLPVVAYSTNSAYQSDNLPNPLEDILKTDLSLRITHISALSPEQVTHNQQIWNDMLSRAQRPPLTQWPPPGSTPTGGWIKTNWTQSAPYNNYCPLDIAHNSVRSQAGCPAVAMAQIVNYYQQINGTTFTDADDYQHNYGGNNYWIDNDAATYGFPTFPALDTLLTTLMRHYRYEEQQTDNDKAALVFACGVAAHQVYGASGSGTFSVSQAFTAYQKFNFQQMELITTDGAVLHDRMVQDVMNARPIHYAIETPTQDAGHNVVVDGYNTDDFFHVNFGWGGSYNGWYHLPTDLPCNLTMLEGAIVGIQPFHYADVFPDSVGFFTISDVQNGCDLTLWSTFPNGSITAEAIIAPSIIAGCYYEYTPSDSLPHTLAYGENMNIHVACYIPNYYLDRNAQKDTLQYNIRILLDNSVVVVPLYTAIASVPPDPPWILTFSVFNYPNPFRSSTSFAIGTKSDGIINLTIYNTKGELVRTVMNSKETAGYYYPGWDGKDFQGRPCAAGIYFYRLTSGKSTITKRMILIK